jgi:cell division transport system permease protein
MIQVRAPRPWWRRGIAFVGNSYRLVVLHGLRSWRRDVPATTPAMGSITLLLLFAGVMGLLGTALVHVAAEQAATASVFDVYISESASPDDVTALRDRLKADSRVLSVQDITPDEALARARSRPGLGDLLDLAGTNPFSEALEVTLRVGALPSIGAVVNSVSNDPAVDPAFPTSYDPQAYAGLRNLALGVGAGGAALVLLFGFISYATCANAIRAIALSRREEIALTRLLAARRWMVRGPFVIEGVMTGALGGVAGAVLVAGAWWLLGRGGPALSAAVLPGVGLRAVEIDAAILISVGMALGAIAAAFGVRRLTA